MAEHYGWEIGIEEIYMDMIECDSCCREIRPNQIHTMQSFKDADVDLILCQICYEDLLGERID